MPTMQVWEEDAELRPIAMAKGWVFLASACVSDAGKSPGGSRDRARVVCERAARCLQQK